MNQSGMDNQTGTGNQSGMDNQTGTGNQAGMGNQAGTDNQAGMGNQSEQKEIKSLTAFLVWSVFLGALGVQYFYIGKMEKGVISIIFFWTGIPAFIAYLNCLRIVKMNIEDINSMYDNVILTDCDIGGRKAFYIISLLLLVPMALMFSLTLIGILFA